MLHPINFTFINMRAIAIIVSSVSLNFFYKPINFQGYGWDCAADVKSSSRIELKRKKKTALGPEDPVV